MRPVLRARTGRPARVALAIGLTAALAATGASWRASESLYTASTTGSASAATGSVAIADDDGGSALISVTGVRPGSTGQQCVRVTYAGSLAATVRLYASGASTTNALSTYLNLQIEEGSGASAYPSCTGFAALSPGTLLYGGTLAAMPTAYAGGLGTWAPTTGAVRDYRVTWTLMATAPTSTQAGTASANLTWEAQNS